MIEDRIKVLGYGTLLDWRYRQATRRLGLVDNAETAEQFYAGPDADILLADPLMVDYIFPFLKYRLNGVATTGFSPDMVVAMGWVLELSQERDTSKHSFSLGLEAGVLCGLPERELVPGGGGLPPLVQFLYEKLFFDVRPFLGDSQAVCRLLFSDSNRLERRGAYDFLSKVIAYGLGFKEFSRWRNGSKTKAVKAVQDAMHDVNRYMTGLEMLGKDKPEDLVEGYCRLFAILPDIDASTTGRSEEASRRYKEYWLSQMRGLAALLAQLPGMNPEGARIIGVRV